MTVADLVSSVLGPDIPVAVRAYDGSRLGPSDASATLVLRSPDALRRIATSPGELGIGRVRGRRSRRRGRHLRSAGAASPVHEKSRSRRHSCSRSRRSSGRVRCGGWRLHRVRPGCGVGGTRRLVTRRRSRTTTTSPTSSTGGSSDRRSPIRARYGKTPTSASKPRRPPSTTSCAASSACVRACGCSTSGAGGGACCCTRRSTTGFAASA